MHSPDSAGGPDDGGADRWLGRDKALHFAAGAAISGLAYGLCSFAVERRPARAFAAFGAGVLAGVGKEALDAAGWGTPSAKDLAWDLLGAGLGAGLGWWLDGARSTPAAPLPGAATRLLGTARGGGGPAAASRTP